MSKIVNKITYLSPSDSCCPNCGSHNIQSVSRITGYLSLDERFGSGKCCEKAARVDHNGSNINNYKVK